MREYSAKRAEEFQKLVASMPKVLECHQITGEFDYLLKVVVRNKSELQDFLYERLASVPGVERVQTSLSVQQVKATHQLPLQQ